ncbi:MAG: DNA primase, partial [Crocinitomicaceae bacterium]
DRQFDFFRGRVMFPIQSITGRVLGFGGRTLFTDKKIAKYFNSPESIIYNKSEILYGLFFAKGTIVKYDECFLCEGYTDVISMHQAGIENVVSSSGTSLTKEQVKLVKRYTQNLTILYDGDAAGIKASFRGIDLILEEGMNVKVVLFPDGEDPDSFSKKTSSTELEQYIKDHRQDFITFKASILLKENGNDPLKKSDLIRDIVQSVSLIPDQITRSVYVQEIARQFEISESIISNELIKVRRNTIARQIQEPGLKEVEVEKQDLLSPPLPEIDVKENYLYEEELIRLLLRFGTREIIVLSEEKEEQSTSIIELIINEVLTDDLSFTHPIFNRIFQVFVDGIKENVLYSSSYFKRLEDQEIVTFVSDLESREIELSHNWIHHHGIFTKSESDNLYPTVMNGIYNFKYHKVEERLIEIKKSFKTIELSDEDVLLALSEQMALEKVKKVISEKLGRIILK